MYGISSSGKESIALAIERMFDALAYSFLGNIPKLRDRSPFFGSSPAFSLANIFIQSIKNKEPNFRERDVIKSLLMSSFGYIESLKSKTSSSVVESIDSLIKESKIKGTYVSSSEVAHIISKEMAKAKDQLK